MKKTDYTIEPMKDSDWKTVKKSGKYFSLCASEEEAMRSVWIDCDRVFDNFYIADASGNIVEVDRGVL